MADKFEEFIKQQQQSKGSQEGGLSLDQEKEMWLAKINELYALVDESLAEYTASGQATVKYSDITLTEELLGSYTAKKAQILIGRQVTTLTPVGTFLIGARGRVDMQGPKGNVRFVIVPPNSSAPRVIVTIGDQKAPETPRVAPEEWVWKIASPPPRITYIALDINSFRESLMGVING